MSGPVNRVGAAFLLVMALAGAAPRSTAAQARASGLRIGLLAGKGSGPVSMYFGGVQAAWAFRRTLELGVEVSGWGVNSDCVPESHVCSAGGSARMLRVGTGVSLGQTAALRLGGSVGRYDPSYGSAATAVGLDAAFDIHFGSRVALSPGARWTTVPDSDYQRAVGEALTFTMFTVGLRLGL